MKRYIKLLRVHHYIKNLLVFAPLACSGQLLSGGKFLDGLFAWLAFCLVSSIVYIVNDLQDVEKDRLHPVKCKRVIAAGIVKESEAKMAALILLIGALLCNGMIFTPGASLLLLLYLALNLVYSFGLKNKPIIDVTILVAGFLIRVLYGAMVTQITISNWLYLTVIALAFYFALGKRRNELKRIGTGETRQVLKAYSLEFLDKNMYMCMTLANVFYALWSMDEKTATLYNSEYLVFTVPIVLLITMKYSLDVEGESDGDPVEVLIRDKTLMVLCMVYLLMMFAMLYL